MLMKDDKEPRPWWLVLWSLFERALLTYERAPGAFLASAFVFYLPAFAYNLVNPTVQGQEGMLSSVLGLAIYLGAVVLHMAAFVCSAAAGTFVVRELKRGARPGAGDAIGAVMGAMVPLIATCLVAGVLEAIGLCLLFIPGIVFLFWILFAGPVTIEEGLQGWPAIQRGRTLVGEGRWIQVAGVMALGAVVTFCLGLLPNAALRVYTLLSHQETLLTQWLLTFWMFGMSVVVTSLMAAWVGCAYFDIAESLTETAKPAARPPDQTPRSRPTSGPPSAGPGRPPGSTRGR